jgi:hypothetical protein
VLSYALRSQYYTRIALPDVPGRLAILREAIAAAEREGDFAIACEARANAVNDALELGELSEADAILAIAEEIAERLRLPRWKWRLAILRAVRAMLDGDLAEAEARSERAAAMAGLGVRPSDAAGFHAAVLFGVRRAQGRLGELIPALDALAQRPGGPVWQSVLALARIETGEPGPAAEILAGLAARNFTDIRADWSRIPTLTFLTDVCSGLGDAPVAEQLIALLSREAPPIVMSPVACLGSRARPLGTLALVCGRTDQAIELLDEAVAANARIGARIEVARTQLDLLRALDARGLPGDRVRAASIAADTRATAEELGLQRILAGLEERLASAPAPASEPESKPTASAGRARRTAYMRRDGADWTIRADGESTSLRDAKGLRYLHRLLAAPSHEMAAVDLAAGDGEESAPAGRSRGVGRARGSGGAKGGRAGEANDNARDRLRALRDELEEALEFNDLGRSAALREEIEALAAEVTARLGGRERGADAQRAAERARVNVTRALQAVLQRIAEDCPELGHHLQRSIHTGTICAYRPPTGAELDWQL